MTFYQKWMTQTIGEYLVLDTKGCAFDSNH